MNIFPYFVLGFIGMMFLRNIGDQMFLNNKEYSSENWITFISYTKSKLRLRYLMCYISQLSNNLTFSNFLK